VFFEFPCLSSPFFEFPRAFPGSVVPKPIVLFSSYKPTFIRIAPSSSSSYKLALSVIMSSKKPKTPSIKPDAVKPASSTPSLQASSIAAEQSHHLVTAADFPWKGQVIEIDAKQKISEALNVLTTNHLLSVRVSFFPKLPTFVL